LFNRVKRNTPVVITTSRKSFDSIAAANGFKVTPRHGTPIVTISEILKKGSRGDAVRELQRKLTSLGYDTKGIDGIFGSNTEKAVRQFQKDHRLTVDGIVGPATKKVLESK
jgi:peptidoglycan hydrolase-like protein with peptidoglycan-binding domain